MAELIIRSAVIIKDAAGNITEDDDYFRREACISSDIIDSHRTYFAKSSLENFSKASGGRGVPLLDSHARAGPLGRTEQGRMEDDLKVFSIFRVRKNRELGAYASYPNTNGFIDAIRNNDLTDVSIGASDGKMICEICDDDWFNCWHWPGVFYELKENEDPVECILRMEDCGLVELSLVYAGSNCDAVIEGRAIAALEAGKLDRKMVDQLNKLHHLNLDRSLASDKLIIRSKPIEEGPMDLEQALAKINELEADIVTKDNRNAEVEELLETERLAIQEESIEIWKELRGEKVTEDRLKAYTEKISRYNLQEMRDERQEQRDLKIEINTVGLRGDDDESNNGQQAQIDPDAESTETSADDDNQSEDQLRDIITGGRSIV